jgi:elongation factor 1-gamma
VQILEEHLRARTYLVGERVTLADLFATSVMERAFQYVLDRKWREGHPDVVRWFETVRNAPCYAAVAGELVLAEEAVHDHLVDNVVEE